MLRVWWRPRDVQPTLHVATLFAEVATETLRLLPSAQTAAVAFGTGFALARGKVTGTARGQIAQMCAMELARSAMTVITRSRAQSVLSAQVRTGDA